MNFIYYAIASAVICWKIGNWRAWREYYPTILYLIMGNLTYMVLTQAKPLWNTGDFLAQHPFLDISMMVVLYVSTVILYLSFYPFHSSNYKRIAYISFWIVLYSLMELVSHLTGHFNYYNGWSFFYSAVFNAVMFPMLLLHHKKPYLAWMLSVASVYALMFLFHIPFSVP